MKREEIQAQLAKEKEQKIIEDALLERIFDNLAVSGLEPADYELIINIIKHGLAVDEKLAQN